MSAAVVNPFVLDVEKAKPPERQILPLESESQQRLVAGRLSSKHLRQDYGKSDNLCNVVEIMERLPMLPILGADR